MCVARDVPTTDHRSAIAAVSARGQLRRRQQSLARPNDQVMDRIRIGIIGAGANTRARHIPGLRAIAGVSLECVCNRTRASSERIAMEFDIPRVADRWQDIVEATDIDAIVIGTWPHLHAEITVAALAAGKHVLTEARMAATLDEAEAMVAASAARPHLVAQVVPSPFSLDFDVTIAAIIERGELGEIREIIVSHTHGANADPNAPLTWRQDERYSGINILSVGIHYEAVQRWFAAEPTGVIAAGNVFTKERLTADGERRHVILPDSIALVAAYAGGACLSGFFSTVNSTAPQHEVRVSGSSKGLRFDIARGELWHADGSGHESPIVIPPADQRGWQVEADFIASIRHGTPVRLTDFKTALRYMRLSDAVWRAYHGTAYTPLAESKEF